MQMRNFFNQDLFINRLFQFKVPLAYEQQDELLPGKWEIEHIFPQKWQTNYFPDESDATVKEKIEHIGNKLPFRKEA